MSCLNANHVRVFIIPEVRHFFRLLHPWVPNDGVGEIVLLDTHLPTRNYVGYDVLLRRILIDSVCPFVDRYNFPAFLINGTVVAYFIDEGAGMQAGYLATSDVRYFEVSVQEHIEAESHIFTGIVYGYVEVELFFSEDEAVS